MEVSHILHIRSNIGDKETKTPAYLRIANTISERIVSGVYPPGSRLPSGSQLCAEFGVSPMTLRRAQGILADQGLLSAEKGRGTFVRTLDLNDSLFRLEYSDGRWLDRSARVRLLAASTTRASKQVAAKLAIAPGDRVVCLRRLVNVNGNPVMYHTEYVVYDPRRPLVESQLQLTSLSGLLEAERGEGFPRGEITLRASSLSAEVAQALGEPEGTPALCLEHVFQDAAGHPIGWGWFWLRGDSFYLRASVGPC